ncbi:conserved hypothetical protein [Ferroglobus placidus DSM 10642]|uniref:Uncharacterized protein n=1 Tax=Ferroglobus placidus (strain DSM 10642 / AEDII12DO) TaxID=589924 RepID=D3S1L8_FERPA|nr:hypothetical protein [Ferroglobus placidus]ADC66482.1 conserved hypothetical protein [Ferroglobus placidus DSM 10642]
MPWPPKVFWVGAFLFYGWTALCWILEATMKINHIPLAPLWYAGIMGTFLIPLIMSIIYFYFPEKAEEKRARGEA